MPDIGGCKEDDDNVKDDEIGGPDAADLQNFFHAIKSADSLKTSEMMPLSSCQAQTVECCLANQPAAWPSLQVLISSKL